MGEAMKHHTVRDAVRAAMNLHEDGDFWINYLAESECDAHIRNRLRTNDYLDDMRWAERRRLNGHSPAARARLDMPIEPHGIQGGRNG